MSTFISQKKELVEAPPDPTRHVFFHQGMVLGVDDFRQEFAYHDGRLQWQTRDLIGYGTVTGLRVDSELDETGKPRLVVEPGVAVSPRGQLIRVPTRQCAYLNDWLALEKTRQEIDRRGLGTSLTVYVVLCYRDCPTEKVPIPGEPCRSEGDLLRDSRLADDFELKLSFNPPQECEEESLRGFVEWFRQIEISQTAPSMPLADLLEALRQAADTVTSPPQSCAWAFAFDSLPTAWVINAADVCDYLRAAFRVWVTELRPRYQPEWFRRSGACSEQPAPAETPPEECLLLAEVRLPVDVLPGVGAREISDPTQITIHEEERPFLLHLRLLQEWLLCGQHGGAATVPLVLAGDATGPLTATVVEALRGRPLATTAPAPGQVLRFDSASNSWTPSNLAGDVTNALNNTRVSRLQGHTLRLPLPVLPPAPPTIPNGDVLTYDASARVWRNERPQTVTDVVKHPEGEGEFLIVAAGRIRSEFPSPTDGSNYNKLHVTQPPIPGVITLTFDNYKKLLIDQKHQMVVKALPVFNGRVPDYDVYFGEFREDSFTLRLRSGGEDLKFDPPNRVVEIHVEVSAYKPKE